jgi:hypothetical protein
MKAQKVQIELEKLTENQQTNKTKTIKYVRPNDWTHKNLNSVEDKTKHVIWHM